MNSNLDNELLNFLLDEGELDNVSGGYDWDRWTQEQAYDYLCGHCLDVRGGKCYFPDCL